MSFSVLWYVHFFITRFKRIWLRLTNVFVLQYTFSFFVLFKISSYFSIYNLCSYVCQSQMTVPMYMYVLVYLTRPCNESESQW